MIFTLINSVNKACGGRIYTQDYNGLIKKEKKRSVMGGKNNKEGEGEAGGGAGREQAAWWRDTYSDGGEQGFIWDYLTA